MTQFRTEGEPAFPVENKENDNSAASSAGEKTNTEQNQSQEGEQNSGGKKDGGDRGFADDPRWKQREDDWTKRFNEQETRHVGTLQTLREEFETKYGGNKPAADAAPTQVPAWFGGDEAQWKEFSAWNQSLVSKAKEEGAAEAVKQIEAKSVAEQKKIEEATTFFNGEVTAIEGDKTLNPQGLKVDRNKLLKTALDNDLVDSKGQWNYKAAFKLMKPTDVFQAKAALDDRKNLANATVTDGHIEDKQKQFTTSEDFQKPGARPW